MTRYAATAHSASEIGALTDAAFVAAASRTAGAFLDVPLDHFFASATTDDPVTGPPAGIAPDPDDIARTAAGLAAARHPVLGLGSDVWADRGEEAARRLVEDLGLPALTNGMGRGILPGGHPLLVTRARGAALSRADLVVVVGPHSLRLRPLRRQGGRRWRGHPRRGLARPGGDPPHPRREAAGDLTTVLDGIRNAVQERATRPDWSDWAADLADRVRAVEERDRELLTAEADPVHPARIYGELLPRLADDAVVIGDGGDFVSFAGKFVEPQRPGCWLDPGPFGCLGAGMGAALAARIARPSSQVVLLLGDGAAGFALSDVDTLVRHRLPVVMVMGNNSAWALEKGPMQMIYGYDVVADLAPRTRYDQVVTALGGGGELVTDPREIGPALDRAFAAGVPYLVNVVTDVNAAYPRSTLGI